MTNTNNTTINNAMTNEYKMSKFHRLIENYNNSQSDENLIALAKACVFSVLNKIYSASGNENILRIRAQVASGEDETLTNAAVVAILEETNRQETSDPDYDHESESDWWTVDLERPYEKRVLNKKIYIQEDPKDCYKTIITTPIQEVYKAIRREIDSRGSVKADCNGYTYESLTVYDGDNDDIGDVIYKRFGKYMDIGGYVKDFNGADTVYTADGDAGDIYALLEKLNLTARQTKIIQYRLQGYGYKAIGTKLGVRADNVRNALKNIQDKAKKIGLTLDK